MIDYLITGVTGGLGRLVLDHLIKNSPAGTTIIATSSNDKNRAIFESLGVQFRIANFDDPEGLIKAFTGVRKLLFVSTNVFDNARRSRQHLNVVEAARAAGVGHTYYTSLAFGGYSDDSKMYVQAAHYETERFMREIGIPHTSIREGTYTEAFPLFLDWYPDTTEVVLPKDGKVAWASREELGEATAKIMMTDKWDDQQKVLLSGSTTMALSEAVNVINETLNKNIILRYASTSDEYVENRMNCGGDGAWKPRWFHEMRANWYDGLAKGDGDNASSTLEEVLGRKPETGRDGIIRLLKQNPGYRWHQNEPPK